MEWSLDFLRHPSAGGYHSWLSWIPACAATTKSRVILGNNEDKVIPLLTGIAGVR